MIATMRRMAPNELPTLRAMYEEFEPKGKFQGLPPTTTSQLGEWLHQLEIEHTEHFVIDVDGAIVGHAMLCPGPRTNEAEFAIFVHQDFRALGLGKALTRGALNYGCKTMLLDRVWLSVQGANPCALHLFEAVGFRPIGEDEPLSWEVEMERPSHCAQCLGDQCQIFGAALPCAMSFSRRKRFVA
jgi:RimJ/RimL family protein N-acetyltransferase